MRLRELNERLHQQLDAVHEILDEADCEDRQAVINGLVGSRRGVNCASYRCAAAGYSGKGAFGAVELFCSNIGAVPVFDGWWW